MSFEIEIKAHVSEKDLSEVRNYFEKSPFSKSLGEIDKDDIYWGYPNDLSRHYVFRTRREKTDKGFRILFTVKPTQSSENGIESNEEIEFAAEDKWQECLNFQKNIGFVILKRKFKTGWHYIVERDGLSVHVEILNVKYLGWFLEMEICPDRLDGFDSDKAVDLLKKLLMESSLSEKDIETKGYNQMLYECGHQLG